ncbi:CHASE domain-containing protein [Photobacterium sp. WH77]|uniref:CHASE domain-containing protein n=1 Tax=Photobacterium TaxID=657 RepID=UPI001EDC1D0C|nr:MULTISPECIES: CHASE domain-containing protein [Photobacterium]MCG2838487.1 CHASE domain-containing protein [Photobacterium sp. WH77]MCG2846141.1 CHASE domain-containing protein [Photobacterium sp. WH80]MDO6580160.1 CHASE domain-containing protein [Photobacterium sp. 2_MG-2023]
MKRQRLTFIGLLLFAGLILSIVMLLFFSHLETRRIQQEFESDVTEASHAFIQAMNSHFEALYTLQLNLDTNGIPDAKGFAALTDKILTRFPAITALEWIPEVEQADRASLEQRANEWLPGYVITEQVASGERVAASERAVYYPVYYVEPVTGNEAVIGYDMGSHSLRFEAVQRARDTGQLQLTVPLQIQRNDVTAQGILSLLPVYEFPEPMSEAERQDSLLGFVAGVFNPAQIFLSSPGLTQVKPFALTLIDTLAPQPNKLVFSLVPTLDTGPVSQQKHYHYSQKRLTQEVLTREYAPDYRYVHQVLSKGGRRWVIEATPMQDYIRQHQSLTPWWVFWGVNAFFAVAALVSFFVFQRGQQYLDTLNQQHDRLLAVNEKLERMSLIDPLTGIANQRAFEESLDKAVRVARREQSPLVVVLIQIDDYAHFVSQCPQDMYESGLRRLANELGRTLKRPADMVARLDDDRFAAVLPNTNNGEVVARHLRTAAERLNLANTEMSANPYLTVSVGAMTVFDIQGLTAETLFHQTEALLYQAQQEGFNKVSAKVRQPQASTENALS